MITKFKVPYNVDKYEDDAKKTCEQIILNYVKDKIKYHIEQGDWMNYMVGEIIIVEADDDT